MLVGSFSKLKPGKNVFAQFGFLYELALETNVNKVKFLRALATMFYSNQAYIGVWREVEVFG